MKKIRFLLYSFFCFLLVSRQVFGGTNAYFSKETVFGGNSFSTGDWTRPGSKITSEETLVNTSSFSVDYLATDNAIDHVELWYSFNYGGWQYFGDDVPSSPGSFSFTSPEGDGHYQLLTVAIDQYGNIEDKNINGIDDNLEIDVVATSVASEVYEVQVDTSVPFTVLSLDEFGDDWLGANRFSTSELLANGNFEDTLDPESSWVWEGDGDHRVVSDLEADVKSGTNSAVIGWFDADPLSDGVDSIYQLVSLPSTSSPTLSFWYRVVSSDIVDYDWFETKVVDNSDPSDQEVIIRTGSDEVDGWSGDTLWREVTHSLSRWAGKTVKIIFSVINHDEPGFILDTYALIDDVRVTLSDNFVTTDKQVVVAANDTGSGVDDTYYQINDGGWQLSDGDIDLADEGVSSGSAVKIDYYSIDIAGNTEAIRSLELKTDDSKDYFSVVINEFMPNPIGNENSPAVLADNEWVELYNNGDSVVDVSGWIIAGGIASDLHPVAINGSMTESGSTTVAAHGKLRIYANFYLNNTGADKVKLRESLTNNLVDSFQYPYSAEGKSWKRDPDGTGTWSDPEVDQTIKVDINRLVGNKVAVVLENVEGQVSYELIYLSNGLEKGIAGEIAADEIIDGKAKEELYLGICSSGEACVSDLLDSNLINLTLKVNGQVVIDSQEFEL